MAEKPTILLVHGSWHTPQHYQQQLELFQHNGFETSCPQLPSFAAAPTVGVPEDAACIRAELEKLVHEQQKSVIVLAHSYGGIVSTQAVDADFGVAKVKAAGRRGGVLGILFVSAFVVPVGESLGSALGGGPPPNTVLPPFIPVDANGMCTMLDPGQRFYNDLSAEEREHWISLLKPCPAITQTQTVSYAAYLHHPVTYLACENDQALPAFLQRKMIEDVEKINPGLRFEIETSTSGHSPFLSQPHVLLEVVGRMVKRLN